MLLSPPLLLLILEDMRKGRQDGDDSAIGTEHVWPARNAPDRCVRLIALMESVPGLNEGAGPWQGHFPPGTAKTDVTGSFHLLSASHALGAESWNNPAGLVLPKFVSHHSFR